MTRILPSQTQKQIAFTIWGIPWTMNTQLWQFVVPKMVFGLVIAFIAAPAQSALELILIGLGYGVMLNLILILHIGGHIFSSRLVAPPMAEVRITSNLIETRYDDDPQDLSSYVHLVRAAGGPAINTLVGTMALLAWLTIGGHGLLFFALGSKLMGMLTLLPIAGLDGVVIWRELNHLARE